MTHIQTWPTYHQEEYAMAEWLASGIGTAGCTGFDHQSQCCGHGGVLLIKAHFLAYM